MKLSPSVNNEKGTALIIALMLLVLLTLLGMAATTTSTLEIMIADNERDYKVNFYRAESAAIQAAVVMENQPDPKNEMKGWGPTWGPTGTNAQNWLRTTADATRPDMTLPDSWDALTDPDDTGSWKRDGSNINAVGFANGNIITAYAVEFNSGGVLGDSLMLTSDGERKYPYVVYGHSNNGSGRVLIEVGYKRQF